MGIPENIKALRTARKMSQTSLAKKAGLSQQLFSQLENGKNRTTKYLPQIARALNVSIHDIDPTFGPDGAKHLSPADGAAELAEIFDRLSAYPAWQDFLLDQAKRLEQRVRDEEAQSPPKAATDR